MTIDAAGAPEKRYSSPTLLSAKTKNDSSHKIFRSEVKLKVVKA